MANDKTEEDDDDLVDTTELVVEEDDDLDPEVLDDGLDIDAVEEFNEADFDEDFDDDFEEEHKDDYEIEIDDEISTEFGLGSNANKEPEIVDGLEDFEDFDNVD